jgi:GTPase SAR1 family protein
MHSILRIGIVGAPHSGKTSLINYLRDALKDEYQVMIADEPPTIVLRSGLDPERNFNIIGFQIECLKEYSNVYKRIDHCMNSIFGYDPDKSHKVVILYDTLPELGKCYLPNEPWMLGRWEEHYNKYKEDIFKHHEPDKIFYTDLLQGEFSTKGNIVRRNIDTEDILEIAEKIEDTFEGAVKLPNDIGLEARADMIIDYIDSYFNPTPSVKLSVSQSCNYCEWHETRDINDLYHYCPKCGKMLPIFRPGSTSGGPLDPLGIEARNKMFYVDYEKLPFYNSGV